MIVERSISCIKKKIRKLLRSDSISYIFNHISLASDIFYIDVQLIFEFFQVDPQGIGIGLFKTLHQFKTVNNAAGPHDQKMKKTHLHLTKDNDLILMFQNMVYGVVCQVSIVDDLIIGKIVALDTNDKLFGVKGFFDVVLSSYFKAFGERVDVSQNRRCQGQ